MMFARKEIPTARRARIRSVVAAIVAVGAMASVTPLGAQQGVSLGIRYVGGQKTSLHILPISGATGDSLATIIARDLQYSDRFAVSGPQNGPLVSGPVNYNVFSALAVQGVVQGTILPSGYLRIALHDVGKKAVVNQKDFPLIMPANSAGWRMSVHGVSDGIEEWITGQRGIAQTQIAFSRDGRIWTVDSDGANAMPRTTRGMSPAWTPNGRGLVYSILESTNNPLLFIDLSTGAQRTLTRVEGAQDITPAVSPDGRTVFFGRIVGAGTDLYSVPITGGTPTRVTVGRGSGNLSPSFSPDGQRIVFVSDRVGNPEVYIADVDGTNAEALTTPTYGERGQRVTPAWSPDGRLVAYTTRLSDNSFQIMTLNLRDQQSRQVTSDGRNENPSWAPDSRHLVVASTRGGNQQLWVHDLETGSFRQLTRGAPARHSAWSPRLNLP